jgi:hypothetical protein
LRDPALIPLSETARLLFNRASGLFYSEVALYRNDDRVRNGFIERNHAKTRLALADAVLAAHGLYHFSCRERHQRLDQVPAPFPPHWERLRAWHAAGVEFKLHPRHQHPTLDQLHATQDELREAWLEVFLWIEGKRLGSSFASAPDYIKYPSRLFPEGKWTRHLLLHARDLLKRGAALPGWTDYPRAALQRSLVAVLSSGLNSSEARRTLGLPPTAPVDLLHTTYERWWKFYN